MLAGPVDYVIVEFETAAADGSMAAAIMDLVERGIITVLDVAMVSVGTDGSFTVVDIDALDGSQHGGVTVLAGARTGLIDDEDLANAAGAITAGSLASVIVYENTWAQPFVTAAHRIGAQFVASGRVPADELVAAVEALG